MLTSRTVDWTFLHNLRSPPPNPTGLHAFSRTNWSGTLAIFIPDVSWPRLFDEETGFFLFIYLYIFFQFSLRPLWKKSKVSHHAWSCEAPLCLYVCHSAPVSLQVGSFADHLLRINFGCSTQGFALPTQKQFQHDRSCVLLRVLTSSRTDFHFDDLVGFRRTLPLDLPSELLLHVPMEFQPDGWLLSSSRWLGPHQSVRFIHSFFFSRFQHLFIKY